MTHRAARFVGEESGMRLFALPAFAFSRPRSRRPLPPANRRSSPLATGGRSAANASTRNVLRSHPGRLRHDSGVDKLTREVRSLTMRGVSSIASSRRARSRTTG